MFVPTEEVARAKKVKWICDVCFDSHQDRLSLYDRRRRYFLFGSYNRNRVLYNRMFSHIDLVSSFLYAADKVRFTVAAPPSADDDQIKIMQAIQANWNDEFRDAGLAYEFAEALEWSIVFDSMFIKVGWNSARDELNARVVTPHQFGVFDESETDLDSQEAFVHSYSLPWENAVMRLIRAGKRDQIPRLNAEHGAQASTFPPVLQNMIITGTGGLNMGGPVSGTINPDYEPETTYEPKSDAPKVNFKEVWIWDDVNSDYIMIVMADPDIVLEDSRDVIRAITKKGTNGKVAPKFGSKTNYFLPGEHPFIHISPYRLLDYFWGESHSERLIPLQRWTNERLDQIHEILEMQVDPAKVFSGFMGLTDEKASALGGPGSWVVDQLPGAKVDRLIPEMPEDLFAEVTSIGQLFLEASGLTETVMGRGEQGVRGRGHAKQLATTGSGRIRKTAVGLEPALVRLGDIGLKLKKSKDATRLKTDAGQEFVLAQVDTQWNMRVAGHSHSPLFSDEEREMAALLFKARAIDREMFISLMHPPGESNMIHQLRKRVVAERQMQATQAMQPRGKPGGGKAQPANLD